MVKAGIIGGAGYTGGELTRILLNHPDVVITFIHSRSNAGKKVSDIHTDLAGDTPLIFSATVNNDVDVIFLCVGHGEAKEFLLKNEIDKKIRVIDLSQDHRLANNDSFVYGLPELNREKISRAQNVANPGCFATAIQLGLLPLAKKGMLEEVYSTGITGSTGAGQGLSPTSHFSWRANNIQAYKSLSHQHMDEISVALSAEGATVKLHFIPWRGDFTRGIFVSSQMKCELPVKEVYEIFREYYSTHPFVKISTEPISLKQVVNTNKCLIQLEQEGSQLVIHSAIDNLLKGASGQAVQNMNIMFGLDETAGLKLKANYY